MAETTDSLTVRGRSVTLVLDPSAYGYKKSRELKLA